MPTLTVSILPETKVLLDALSALLQSPAGRVVDLVTRAHVQRLSPQESRVLEEIKHLALGRLNQELPTASPTDRPVATYEFSRLCFKRDVIEALAPHDTFRVATPVGVFQMTKADFDRDFSNVARSRSYLENGSYNYPVLPSKAERFRVNQVLAEASHVPAS
jgi:hypothetical protein